MKSLGLAAFFWVKGLYKKWQKIKSFDVVFFFMRLYKLAFQAASGLDGAKGTRTLTALRSRDFKSLVSTISPPPRVCGDMIVSCRSPLRQLFSQSFPSDTS